MQDLKERTFQFAVAIGKLVLDLPYNIINKEYTGQLIRSSASVVQITEPQEKLNPMQTSLIN
jgi:hypothetical protein